MSGFGKDPEWKQKYRADELKDEVNCQAHDLEWQEEQPDQRKKKKDDKRQRPADHQ
jgi:hypothetical protein